MYKRIIASALAVVIFFSVFSAPKAKAIDPVSVGFLVVSIGHLALDAYRTWRAEHPSAPDSEFPGYDPGGVVSSEDAKGGHFSSSGSFGTAYNAYVETLPAVSIGNDGSFTLPMRHSWAQFRWVRSGGGSSGMSTCTHTGKGHVRFQSCDDAHVTFEASSGDKAWRFTFEHSTVSPVDGFLTFSRPVIRCIGTSGGEVVTKSVDNFQQTIPAMSCSAGQPFVYDILFGRGQASGYSDVPDSGLDGFEGSLVFVYDRVPYVTIHPYTSYYNVQSTSDDDIYNIYSRPSSITGNYGVITESGDVQQIESQTIVNEGDHSVYNPVTNTTYDMQDWNYDYSDRSYHITTTEGDTVTVTYGDEHVTINEGGETYNVYYLVSNSGSSSGTGSDGSDTGSGSGTGTGTGEGGEGLLSKFGRLLGIVVTAPFRVVGALIGTLLDYLIELAEMISDKLTELVEMVLSWFDVIPQMFDGFLDFLGVCFSFLPSDMLMLITFGLAAVVFVGILKAVRGR